MGASRGGRAPDRRHELSLPSDWEKDVRERLTKLATIPVPFHLEMGLHPSDHACVSCTAARRVRAISEEVRANLVWVEVAPVLPGQEGVAAPPPWTRVLLPGSEAGPVRFLGPLRGDLLGALACVLEDLTSNTPPSAEDWKEVLPRLRRRHHFRVFSAARCLDAPAVVRYLARVVHTSPDRLALDVVDVECFPAMAKHYGVRWMPTVTIDDFAHFYGHPDSRALAHSVADVLPSGGFAFAGPRGESPLGSF